VGLIALITACLALGLPQWTIDSQLYHLPRVEQWVQNHCLALFPTSYDLQDFFPPGAELLILQFRLLAGSQVLSGLVQWGALLLGCLAVAGSVRALGGGARAQALGVLAWATLPMAVLQSSTTQSDLAAAAGALLTAYFALRHDQETEAGWDRWAAAAAGAALMLKGTNYLFIPAFGLWVVLRRDWGKPQAARLTLLLALAAAPSAPYWCRNLALCGSPLGTASMHFLKNPSPASVFSNAVKALGDELRCPSESINAGVVEAVGRIHSWTGIPPENPDWIFADIPYGFKNYTSLYASWHEDYSGAPLQTLAVLILLAAILLRPARWRKGYLIAWLSGALLYLLLVRWNVWDTRLHLPFYALAAAPLGLGLDRIRKPWLLWAAVALLAGQGLWAACENQGRPMSYLFRCRQLPTLAGLPAGQQAATLGRSIGLLTPARCCPEYAVCEYGVWLGVQRSGREVCLQHLIASSDTAALLSQKPWNNFRPDVIVADALTYKTPGLSYKGRRWLRLGDDGAWAIYVPIAPDKPAH
jgi:hypothetical protein